MSRIVQLIKGLLGPAVDDSHAGTTESGNGPKPWEAGKEASVKSDWSALLASAEEEESARAGGERQLIRRAGSGQGDALPEGAMLLDRLLTDQECQALIGAAEQSRKFGVTNFPKKYRGNLRMCADDAGLAAALWERIKPFVPQRLEVSGREAQDSDGSWNAVGLNGYFRLSKYYAGDRFERHVDGAYTPSPNEKSMFTVNIYLNGDFNGGATRFFTPKDSGAGKIEEKVTAVYGQPGQALIFLQPTARAYLTHDGEELRSGPPKYLLRTDVMYRRV